jgi:type II secretory pathway component PulJ
MKGFRAQRKSFMTLLETLIAISLLALLLTIVFSFFRELSVLSQVTEQKQKESFRMRYVETRLAFIFERLVNENETTRKFYFFTQPTHSQISSSPSLIFTFNNGVRPDPNFSSDVLGRLYVDLDKRLTLVTWPIYTLQPHAYMQKEILLENVVGLRYEFYAAPERISNENAVKGSGENKPGETKPQRDRWQSEWPKSHKQMPSIIKITLDIDRHPNSLERRKEEDRQEQVETVVLTFVLPSSKNPIYYPPA